MLCNLSSYVLTARQRPWRSQKNGRRAYKWISNLNHCRLGYNELLHYLHPGTVLPTTTASRLTLAPSLRGRRLLIPKRQLTDPIHQRAALLHATGHAAITRRYIQARVAGEEVARPQQQAHRLGGHDGEVLGAGEVGEAERVPEDDVGVLQVRGRVGRDPGWDALGGVAGGLRHVAACWVELGVVVYETWLEEGTTAEIFGGTYTW